LFADQARLPQLDKGDGEEMGGWEARITARGNAFVNDAGTVRKILDSLGESALPPRIVPAREPYLWESVADFGQAGNDPQWEGAVQPEPEFERDQRVAW
jgi:hypothetical protein